LLVSSLILASVGLFALVWWLHQLLARPERVLPITAEWLNQLSVDRYRPMLRLLDEEDFRILRSQPGCTPEMAEKVREQRYRIFQGYLRSLESDFHRVSSALRMLISQAPEDRPDLAGVLLRTEILFACGMWMVRVRLRLYGWGVGSVNVAPLVQLFNRLRGELSALVPAADAC
jgi:hypothetical protein